MHSLILPYADSQGNDIMKSMNNNIKCILPNNMKTAITYTATVFDTKFHINDATKNQHGQDSINYNKCPKPTCNEDDIL